MLNFLQRYFKVDKKLVVMQVTTRLSSQCLFISFQLSAYLCHSNRNTGIRKSFQQLDYVVKP